jgi:hypothetical protein
MPLLQLPAEVLIQIFDHVGSSYFRSDLSRLRVCRQWSKLAHTACFQDFLVNQNTLRRLMSSPYIETTLPLIGDSVEALELNFKGYDNWDFTLLGQTNLVSTWDEPLGRELREAWTIELDNHLSRLATTIKQSRRLHTICIQAVDEKHPSLFWPSFEVRSHNLDRRDYLSLSTIRTFLSAKNLSSLDLDLCGTGLTTSQLEHQEHGAETHVCTSIAALLTTLRRLRLRIRTICPDVLKSQQHSTNLRLDDVIINLSVQNDSVEGPGSSTPAGHCFPSLGRSFQLREDMEKQAQVLVTQLAAPKIVRILMYRVHPKWRRKMFAFDALTTHTVMLMWREEWDDNGEIWQERSAKSRVT